ncbi:hypothetical protein [Fodinicola feengrottensis]|uniref:hypothetical protein n=1 Tax=Fodinicola feengrottensis TaxID=435914 RepID=UPI0024435629|nr:hypothetical protein [Fodinicola feengrottensis]
MPGGVSSAFQAVDQGGHGTAGQVQPSAELAGGLRSFPHDQVQAAQVRAVDPQRVGQGLVAVVIDGLQIGQGRAHLSDQRLSTRRHSTSKDV